MSRHNSSQPSDLLIDNERTGGTVESVAQDNKWINKSISYIETKSTFQNVSSENEEDTMLNILPTDIKDVGTLDTVLSNDEEDDGTLESILSNDKEDDRTLDTALSNDKMDDGTLENILSNEIKDDGTLDTALSNDKMDDGTLENILSNEIKDDGTLDTILSNDTEDNRTLENILSNDIEDNGTLDTVLSNDKEDDHTLDTSLSNDKDDGGTLENILSNDIEADGTLENVQVLPSDKEDYDTVKTILSNDKEDNDTFDTLLPNDKDDETLDAILSNDNNVTDNNDILATILSKDQDDGATETMLLEDTDNDNTLEVMLSNDKENTTSITAKSSNENDALLLSSDKNVTTVLSNSSSNTTIVDKQSISACEPEERVSYLSSACNKYHKGDFTRRYGLKYLYVNDKYKYAACLPQKAGCTTWKMILVNNAREEALPADFQGGVLHGNGMKKYNIRRLDTYTKQQQKTILNEYYKFIVVRHPFDRLVSSYNDKIVLGNFPSDRKRVIDLNMKNHGKSETDLRAFFEYIIKTKANMNRHWAPATEICDPCNVQYDKIVKLETHTQDLLDVISHLGPYNRTNDVHANYKGSGAASAFSWRLQAYKDIGEKLLADMLKLGFDKDLDLFGYSAGDVSDPLGMEVKCASEELRCC